MPEKKTRPIPPSIGRAVSSQEMEDAFVVPALSANRYFLQPVTSGVRIAFGEVIPGTEKHYFRVAVTLSNYDAVQLYKLIQHMVKPFEDAAADGEEGTKAQEDA